MVKIGIVQMKTCENKEANIAKAKIGIEECVKKGAEIVILPEIFNSPYNTKKFREFSEPKNGKTWTFLSNTAKEHKIILVGGSIPEIDNNKIYNTSFIFNSEGKQISFHRKMHLFDIDIKGGQSFKESESLTAGNSINVFDTPFCKIGICICFDMRFPELSRLMVLKGAKIIIVPAAFNMTTGPPHWESMFKQRAIDNQCFTIGVAPSRNMESSYISYANSIVINPWGNIIYKADEKECFDVIDIDLNEVENIRKQLPLISARRCDVYTLSHDNFTPMVVNPNNNEELMVSNYQIEMGEIISFHNHGDFHLSNYKVVPDSLLLGKIIDGIESGDAHPFIMVGGNYNLYINPITYAFRAELINPDTANYSLLVLEDDYITIPHNNDDPAYLFYYQCQVSRQFQSMPIFSNSHYQMFDLYAIPNDQVNSYGQFEIPGLYSLEINLKEFTINATYMPQ